MPETASAPSSAVDGVPSRQVRAVFTDNTVIVYQAYSSAIAGERRYLM